MLTDASDDTDCVTDLPAPSTNNTTEAKRSFRELGATGLRRYPEALAELDRAQALQRWASLRLVMFVIDLCDPQA